ncbi:transposase family protein [Streptomyces sp. NPDC048270]|uniref:helix-turn-helix domain-containing protein n=1 Tax=Streptomyces sp. NPDC048270 TaxID=3154615 RepID=UPI0033D28B88
MGAKHRLVFIDRLLATLVHFRHGATHDVPACWFGVDRSTITRANGEVRPLLAAQGCTIASGIRHPAPHPRRGHRPPRRERENRDHRRHRDPAPQARRRPQGAGEFISGKNKQP